MKSAWTMPWGWVWRLMLLANAIAFYAIPPSWGRSAQHFGPELLVIVPVALTAVWIGPFVALIDSIRFFVEYRRSHKGWEVARQLIWAVIIISPLVGELLNEFSD